MFSAKKVLNNLKGLGVEKMKDEDIKLPELPNADLLHRFLSSPTFRSFYSPEQMTEYAREAVRLNQPITTNDQPIPFDLEAAKRGEPIVTRDGRKAEFIAHEPSFKDGYQLIIKVEDESAPMFYHSRGSFITNYESGHDLFMAPKPKRVVYLNLYDNGNAEVYKSEQSARFAAYKDCEIIAHPVELP